jgi:hypothetical protein
MWPFWLAGWAGVCFLRARWSVAPKYARGLRRCRGCVRVVSLVFLLRESALEDACDLSDVIGSQLCGAVFRLLVHFTDFF